MTERRLEDVSDRNLALELVRVTEAAAIAASRWIGRGKKNEADGAAVEAMRKAFDTVAIDGTVVIGEGEMDEAPMLYIGEKVGQGGPAMDIAVDPLEGTSITAKGGANAIATVALAEQRQFPARARHLHGQDRRRRRPAGGRRRARRAGRGKPAQPRPRQARSTSPNSWSACWTASAMPKRSPKSARPVRASP